MNDPILTAILIGVVLSTIVWVAVAVIYSMYRGLMSRIDVEVANIHRMFENTERDEAENLNNVYREIDSRIDKLEAKLTKKPKPTK